MFQTDNKNMQFALVTFPLEINGPDERRPCAHLKMILKTDTSVLSQFGIDANDFYDKKTDEERDLADQGEDKKVFWKLKNPELQNERTYDWNGSGYRVIIPEGIDEKTWIYLIQCELKKFKIKFVEGGVIEVTFNVKCYTNREDSGALVHMQGHDYEITLEPPSAEAQAQGTLVDMED